MTDIILNTTSSEHELKAYFEAVCKIADSNSDEFPINLDEVWPLAYAEKGAAVRALKNGFIEDVDYKTIDSLTKREIGSTRITDYYITVSCLEYLIARKHREVFEIYRRVFHAARKGELHPKPLTKSQQTLEAVKQLCEIAQQQVELEQRQMEMESEQKLLAQKVSHIEDAIKPNGFMSVMGFANIHHLNIGKKAAQAIGRVASKWCKQNGYIPEKTTHERYGTVNTYPKAALKASFAEFYCDMVF